MAGLDCRPVEPPGGGARLDVGTLGTAQGGSRVVTMVVLLSFIFLLSGAAGLLFETLFFRLAGLGLGSTVWTASIVLAAFMAGLGLGNAAAARYGPSAGRPLRLYALIELLVGVFGFAVVALLPFLNGWLRLLLSPLAATTWALNLARFVVAFALILVPTAAMGSTLPLLTKTLGEREEDYGRVLGSLYGWNTMGGVAGALAGELWLIPRLGLLETGLLAAGLNLAASGSALLLDRHAPAPRRAEPREALPATPSWAPGATRYLWAAAVSGCLLLALEVVWFRFLQLYVQGTALAFAVMLATILLGIAAGGLLAARLLSLRAAAATWLAPAACLAGASVAFLYAVFDPVVRGAANFMNDVPATIWLSCRLMLPAALLSGVLFTFIGRALRASYDEPARTTGWLTLANTVGATLGALLGGFVLLPGLGMERSFFLLALGYAAVAALCWRRPSSRAQACGAYGSAALLALVLALFPFGLQNHFLKITLSHFECTGAAATTYREGLNETILLLRFDWGGRPFGYRLITNGYSMSGTYYMARRYMKLFAFWPMALKPDIRRALLISYGMGNTAAALRELPSLRSVDVVDPSREILELGEVMYDPADNPLRDPRFRVHLEDGRFFLQTTDARFDLITGEPPPPKLAGIANLYSREFFELVRARLEEGGVVTYWLPVQMLTPADARAILRAFCDVFPTCSLWNGSGDDWIMAGFRGRAPRPTERAFAEPWARPRVARQLADIAVEVPEQMGALFIADAPALRAWIGDAPALEDDKPGRLGFHGPRPAELRSVRALADARLTRRVFEESELIRSVWPAALRERTRAYFDVQQALNDVHADPDHESRYADLHRVLATTALRTVPLLLLQSEPRFHEIAREAEARGEDAPGLTYRSAVGALADRDFARAARLFAAARGRDPSPRRAADEAFALACAGRAAEAASLLDALPPAARSPATASARAWLAGSSE